MKTLDDETLETIIGAEEFSQLEELRQHVSNKTLIRVKTTNAEFYVYGRKQNTIRKLLGTEQLTVADWCFIGGVAVAAMAAALILARLTS